jgi:DNA-binding response OmpR family regulator
MLTARGESSAIFKAQGLGATDFLMKPCESGELSEIVRKYMR